MNPRITPGWGWFLPPFPGKIGDTYGLIVGENHIDVSKAIVNHLPILPQMVGIPNKVSTYEWLTIALRTLLDNLANGQLI